MTPRTRNLVDPDLHALVDNVPSHVLTQESLAEMRQIYLQYDFANGQAAPATDMAVHMVPGPIGTPDVRVITYRPEGLDGAAGCILHLHGGGYIVGNPNPFESPHRIMAASLGGIIASVDYHLAPETRALGAVEDCYATLAWRVQHAFRLGVDTARIGVMGESAGGGLAAAPALLARDRGEYALAFQSLIYPMLDDRTCTAHKANPHVGEFIWTADNNRFARASLLGIEPAVQASRLMRRRLVPLT